MVAIVIVHGAFSKQYTFCLQLVIPLRFQLFHTFLMLTILQPIGEHYRLQVTIALISAMLL